MDELSPALSRIKNREEAVMTAEAALRASVLDARQRGETWKSIGNLWGISPQAAQQRVQGWVEYA